MDGIIEIKTHGKKTVREWDFTLNGVNINKYITNVNIDMDSHRQIPLIKIEFIGILEIPEEIQGLVEIYQKKDLNEA